MAAYLLPILPRNTPLVMMFTRTNMWIRARVRTVKARAGGAQEKVALEAKAGIWRAKGGKAEKAKERTGGIYPDHGAKISRKRIAIDMGIGC